MFSSLMPNDNRSTDFEDRLAEEAVTDDAKIIHQLRAEVAALRQNLKSVAVLFAQQRIKGLKRRIYGGGH
jgi:hypothetical protein